MKAPSSLKISGKHNLITKDNSTTVITTAITVVVVVFAVVGSRALIDSMLYQNHVIGKKEDALKILESNVVSVDKLNSQLQAFESQPESKLGTKEQNSKIVLDALPSKYDYPAVATSLGEIANVSGVSLSSFAGTDNELTATQSSINPEVIVIPLSITVSGPYENIQKLIANLQRSIRPMHVLSISFSGTDSAMQAEIKLRTYYQPSKIIDLESKVVPKPVSEKSKKSAKASAKNNQQPTSATGAAE